MEFAGNTTMHGIRFLVEPTKFLTRRFAVTQLLHCRRFTAKIAFTLRSRHSNLLLQVSNIINSFIH